MKLKQRVWEIVEVAKPGDNVSRVFDLIILILIFLNVIVLIVESINPIHRKYSFLFDTFELLCVIVFTIEYLGRLWSCTSDPQYQHPFWGRLRFSVKFVLLIDMLAILPFYIPFLGVNLMFLRILRIMRVLRIAKIYRYSTSLQLIKRVLISRKEELVMTTMLMIILLLLSSCVLYYCENDAQPHIFSSIPATMWWAVATLTTVGYGDMFPITPLGKFFATIIAVLGIGMFALPAGILGSGFIEELQKKNKTPRKCPHCGKTID